MGKGLRSLNQGWRKQESESKNYLCERMCGEGVALGGGEKRREGKAEEVFFGNEQSSGK